MKAEGMYECTRCKLMYRENEIRNGSQEDAKRCPNCGCTVFTAEASRRLLSFVLSGVLMVIAGAVLRLKFNVSLPVTALLSFVVLAVSYLVISRLQGSPDIREDLEFAGHKMGEVGANWAKTQDWDRAILFYTRALDLLKTTSRKDLERWTLERLGTAHMKMGHLDDTERYYKQALQLANELDDKKTQAQICNNLGVLEQKRKGTSGK